MTLAKGALYENLEISLALVHKSKSRRNPFYGNEKLCYFVTLGHTQMRHFVERGANDEQLKSAQGTFRELSGVLGLKLEEKQGSGEQETQVNALIAERNEARKQKQWARSDQIRDQLKELGVTIEDSKDGTTWRWG